MRSKLLKSIALTLVVTILSEIIFPTVAYALSSGPSQPEVQSFEPIGTTELVDLSSGDFNYNIPLLDVGGYPVNISYHSGISMDQEASWVGLGWNINPGVINRNMRGLPDDFDGSKGDNVLKKFNQKTSVTFGVSPKFTPEIFEIGKGLPLKLSAGLDLNWNNYKGLGFGIYTSASLGITDGVKGGLTLSSSNANGVSLSPSFTFGKDDARLNVGVSTSFNTREGLKTLSLTADLNMDEKEGHKSNSNDEVKQEDGTMVGNDYTSISGYSGGVSFGATTYVPKNEWPTRNWGVSVSFKGGVSLFAIDGLMEVRGYAYWQTLAFKERNLSAYGYLNSQNANGNKDALHDFNREKEGPFNVNTPSLPLTNHTYDMYSVSGHGVGGLYRPYRSDVGTVFDPSTNEFGMDGSVGVDIGGGNIIKGGVDLSVNIATTATGRWETGNGNSMNSRLGNIKEQYNNPFESAYFKQYGDLSVDEDNNFHNDIFNEEPVYVEISRLSASNVLRSASGASRAVSTGIKRSKRKKRNQNISYMTIDEASKFGVQTSLYQNQVNTSKGHHIGEFTTLKSDGTRYVYGIPAYNKLQKEVSFATGHGLERHTLSVHEPTGVTTYDPADGDNSQNNQHGVDHYFSSDEYGAYAHSYLLSSILSSDYIDNDGTPGLTPGDMGSYTKFNYFKIDNFKWRTPVAVNSANAEAGRAGTTKDDKGSYVYGEKEMYYLESIESKNYIAIFNTSERLDALPALGENGGIDLSGPKTRKLDNIKLYDRNEYLAAGNDKSQLVPLKSVFFEYDYTLCPYVPNNYYTASGTAVPTTTSNNDKTRDASYNNTTPGTGKLTLKKIYFTYQNSEKARFSPYQFTYNSINPSYNPKLYDRWGVYKPYPTKQDGTPNESYQAINAFPYSDQLKNISTDNLPLVAGEKQTLDERTYAWTMTNIKLPSGGEIEVEYESDDYAYVQDKKAMQMFRIKGLGNINAPTVPTDIHARIYENNASSMYYKVYIDLPRRVSSKAELGKYYMKDHKYLYFNFLVNLEKPSRNEEVFDYVKGYAEIEDFDVYNLTADGYASAYIKVKSVDMGDRKGSRNVSPFFKAAAQYARLTAPEIAFDNPGIGDQMSVGDALRKFAGVFTNFKELVTGPNGRILSDNKCQDIKAHDSYVRLNAPSFKKLGGGSRVKGIKMKDNANSLGMGMNAEYGQSFDYTTDDLTYGRISSGVATYEPMFGNDENPHRLPVDYSNNAKEKLLVGNDKFYMEEPFGEVFFPSPSVVYSQVKVSDIVPASVTRHATGFVTHEFYTAKDFPTKTQRTPWNNKNIFKLHPWTLSMLKVYTIDKLAASQGFAIELNDMPGKPKAKTVYGFNPDGNNPYIISRLKYNYKSNGDRLTNQCDVITKEGKVVSKTIGVDIDIIFDSNESNIRSYSPGVHINAESFMLGPIPIPAFLPLPSYSSSHAQMRYITCTKVITKIGILESVEAEDLGSKVITYNRAYDAETGEVLLTEVQNEYDDPVYNLSYPAHWGYDGMGQAYKNLGMKVKFPINSLSNGLIVLNSTTIPDATELNHLTKLLAEGDEMYILSPDADPQLKKMRFYITRIVDIPGERRLEIMAGDPTALSNAAQRCQLLPPGSDGLVYDFKIIRSGRRNMQSLPIASVTSLTNPVKDIVSGSSVTGRELRYSNVDEIITANALEYHDEWRYDCARYQESLRLNPFFEGFRGNFRLAKTYAFLADRNKNTPAGRRKDGFYNFSAFWTPVGLDIDWAKHPSSWRLVNTITDYDQYASQENENLDAIGRYSAAFYGYNHTRQIGVSNNATSEELFFDNFEDAAAKKGIDVKFTGGSEDESVAHTGKKSMKVNQGSTGAKAEIKGCCPNPND